MKPIHGAGILQLKSGGSNNENKDNWNTVILDGSIPDKDIKMMTSESYDLISDSPTKRIYEAVRNIPYGHVATYSQIAEIAGNKKMSRAVGNALHKNPDPDGIPCFRVVNAKGELTEKFAFGGAGAQAGLLKAEGIEVTDGKVDLKRFQWKPGKENISHPFPPFYDEDSRILILGSFPSVKSREQMFFYGHPQNRFWKVMAAVFDDTVPTTISEKRSFLAKHHIALWDVIASCDIRGSSDASIENVIANDLSVILGSADIRGVFVNGKTAEKYYRKYIECKTRIKAICLPSTSPANAAWSEDKLVTCWKEQLGQCH